MSDPKFKAGERVTITGRFVDASVGYDAKYMDPFIGTVTTISGCTLYPKPDRFVYYTDTGWYWLESVLAPVVDAPVIQRRNGVVASVEYGVRCSRCGDFNEYAIKSADFKCYSCRRTY